MGGMAKNSWENSAQRTGLEEVRVTFKFSEFFRKGAVPKAQKDIPESR